MSKTTSHFVQSPMRSTLPKMMEKKRSGHEPKHLHQHPKQEVRFEAQLTDERVAQHDE